MKSLLKKDARVYDIVIGHQSKISGDLESAGSIRIDGEHKGNIKSEGDVIISQNATVTGNIESDNIEIYGSIVGNVTVNGFVEVYDSGSLEGDLQAKSFNITEGGTFQGHCAINISKADIKKAESKKEDPKPQAKSENKDSKDHKNTKDHKNNNNNHQQKNHKTA